MFNRVQEQLTVNKQTSASKVFRAPRKGWIRAESLAKGSEESAEVLDNIFPTTEGARIRGGSVKHATIDDDVTHLAVYKSGVMEEMFATDATSIYDVTTPADPDVAVTAAVTGQTSGDYCSFQVGTSGGEFLMLLNGSDPMQIYNGDVWAPLSTAAVNSIDYDNGTVAFTVGDTLTGGTSGATAEILYVGGDTTSGTLVIGPVTSGPFQNNETITDGSGGSALADGANSALYSAITGIDTADMSYGWKWKSFVWMIDSATMDAYYLAAGAISGAATLFPLGGVFQKGGSLLFGTSWSQDAGDGLDDYCLFVTTEGEIAVYQGTNPASTFSLVGVYQIGRPLGKNAHYRSGGDVVALTDDGVIPLSVPVAMDRAGQRNNSLAFPIEEVYRQTITERKGTSFPFSCVQWFSETMVVIGVPTFSGLPAYCFVMNSRTGAWCRYTGWDTRCLAVFDDKLYFGTAAGTVVRGETTGADQGEPYQAVWIPRFDTFKRVEEKEAMHARLVARGNNAFTPQLFANADYEVDIPTPESADPDASSNLWDVGIWGPDPDAMTWGGTVTAKQQISEWQAVAAVGHALAPGLQVNSGRVTQPDAELIALHLQVTVGEVMG